MISVVVVILLAAGAWFFFLKGSGKPVAMPPMMGQVTKGSIVVGVSGSGAIAPASKETAKAAENGKIKEFLVKEGDIVKKGQKMVTYEGKDMAEQIKQEELSLKQKQKELEDMQRKMKEQFREGNVDELQMSISRLILDIEMTQSKISSLHKDQKAPDALTSQIDGEIVKLHVVAGDQVSAASNLIDIVDYQHMQVVITVDELEIPKMKLNLPAVITIDALPGQTFQGKVSKIGKEGKAQNGVATFEVTVGFDQIEGALVGMTAQAEIVVEEKHDILTVPIEAVQQGPGGSMVLVPDMAPNPSNDPAAGMGGQPKPVEIGIHNESLMEIKSGLNEGDSVILPIVVPPDPFGGRPGMMVGAG